MALHVMDEANHCLGCKKPRCQQGCPIHTNIPEVIRLLKDNKLDDAGKMLFENDAIKEDFGVTSRCIPFKQVKLSDTCVYCGKPATKMVYWGKAY